MKKKKKKKKMMMVMIMMMIMMIMMMMMMMMMMTKMGNKKGFTLHYLHALSASSHSNAQNRKLSVQKVLMSGYPLIRPFYGCLLAPIRFYSTSHISDKVLSIRLFVPKSSFRNIHFDASCRHTWYTYKSYILYHIIYLMTYSLLTVPPHSLLSLSSPFSPHSYLTLALNLR